MREIYRDGFFRACFRLARRGAGFGAGFGGRGRST